MPASTPRPIRRPNRQVQVSKYSFLRIKGCLKKLCSPSSRKMWLKSVSEADREANALCTIHDAVFTSYIKAVAPGLGNLVVITETAAFTLHQISCAHRRRVSLVFRLSAPSVCVLMQQSADVPYCQGVMSLWCTCNCIRLSNTTETFTCRSEIGCVVTVPGGIVAWHTGTEFSCPLLLWNWTRDQQMKHVGFHCSSSTQCPVWPAFSLLYLDANPLSHNPVAHQRSKCISIRVLHCLCAHSCRHPYQIYGCYHLRPSHDCCCVCCICLKVRCDLSYFSVCTICAALWTLAL